MAMTLNATVQQKLADWRPPGEGRHTLPITDEGSGWSVAITADRQDSIGCLLWEVTLRARAARPDLSLRTWAQETAKRVRGLLEPLKVIEIDDQRNEALLRSDEPASKGDRLAYYELLLQGTTGASLRRYEGFRDPGQRREQVPFIVTHEALARIVADIAS
jgi:hypothetical protein